LVARFGNGKWFEALAFWEDDVPASDKGSLLLQTNDNNPYNGDKNKQWTVRVDVERAGAASVGIYV
jgi:hypothetical protein